MNQSFVRAAASAILLLASRAFAETPVASPVASATPAPSVVAPSVSATAVAAPPVGAAAPDTAAAATLAVKADANALQAEYSAAVAALAPQTDGFSIDDGPAAAQALSHVWDVVARIALDYLERHPGAKEGRLPENFGQISATLESQAYRLDPETYLVSASTDEIGTVFIVSSKSGKPAVAWQIGKMAAEKLSSFAMLRSWSAERANSSCRGAVPAGEWDTCGPLKPFLGMLPPDGSGAPRFYIAGAYAQAAGSTTRGQLSVWRWTKTSAEPLSATSYTFLAGADAPVFVQGDVIRVKSKDEFKTFFTCGACEGRQMEHRLHLTANGVEDGGTRSLVPELDAADAVFEKMLKKEPVGDLAEPEAVKALTPFIEAALESSSDNEGAPSLGMLNDSTLRLKQKEGVLCLSFDEGTLLLTIRSSQGGARVAAAKMSSKPACPAGRSALIREGM